MRWSDILRNPATRTLRQFAALCAIFGGLWSGWLAWDGAMYRALAVGFVAMIVGVIGIARPQRLSWLFVGWMIAVFPLAWLVSNVVLALIFFLLFTPIALLMRLAGRNALRLRKPSPGSLWNSRSEDRPAESYLQQF